jgi:hypothetical protein
LLFKAFNLWVLESNSPSIAALPSSRLRARACCPRAGPSWAARQGGLACQASDCTRGHGPGRAEITDFTRRRKVPVRKGLFFARESPGRVDGAVSRQRPSVATAVVRQAGPHVHALALGRGRPVGPEGQMGIELFYANLLIKFSISVRILLISLSNPSDTLPIKKGKDLENSKTPKANVFKSSPILKSASIG